MRRLQRQFSRLTKKDIEGSNYKQLVDKMAKTYGYQEFKTRSALSLLEMHNHFKIFGQGNRVITATNTNDGWAQVASKYVKSPYDSPRVICVQPHEDPSVSGCHLIKGSINDVEAQVKVVQQMKDQQLDVALMNYLPEYSGFTEIDGFNLNGQILKLMPFLERFLKKGGTFVCKAMEFSETKELTKVMENIFKDVNKHRINFVREDSPMFYYVLKGFGMSPKIILLEEFLKIYAQPNSSKKEVVAQFEQKGLDAEKIARSTLKKKIFEMMDLKVSEDKILKECFRESFLDPLMYIQKWKELEAVKASKSRRELHTFMVKQYGDSFGLPLDLPETDMQMADLLDDIQEIQNPSQERKKGGPHSEQLLDRNAVYMKDEIDPFKQFQRSIYLRTDLNENLLPEDQKARVASEISKMRMMNPQFDQIYTKIQNNTFSMKELHDAMGTSELYEPEEEEALTTFRKDVEQEEKEVNALKSKEMFMNMNRNEVKGERKKPYTRGYTRGHANSKNKS